MNFFADCFLYFNIFRTSLDEAKKSIILRFQLCKSLYDRQRLAQKFKTVIYEIFISKKQNLYDKNILIIIGKFKNENQNY